MADTYGSTDTSGRVLVRGRRTVKAPGRVRINGDWYYSPHFPARIGNRVELRVYDCWGLAYSPTDAGTGEMLALAECGKPWVLAYAPTQPAGPSVSPAFAARIVDALRPLFAESPP